MIKPRTLAACLAAGTFILASCSADATDFKKAAEKAITGSTDKGGLGDGSSATCEDPGSNKTGTTFSCTGTGADGTVYPLTATIVSSTRVEVTAAVPGDDTVTSDDGTVSTDGSGTVDTASEETVTS